MEWYAQYVGDWHDYYRSYRWMPLEGNHSAIGDCQTALKRLKSMAQTQLHDLKSSYIQALETNETRYSK